MHPSHSLRHRILAGLLVLGAFWTLGAESRQVAYRVKAAFLAKFSSFVEWPAEASWNVQAPFVIGILGQDPFGAEFDAAVAGHKTHQRQLAIRRFSQVPPTNSCEILFISVSERHRWKEIQAALGHRPVLTVSEWEGFLAQGGMINFVAVEGKMRFEINLGAAKQAGLRISSRLLQVAHRVYSPGRSTAP